MRVLCLDFGSKRIGVATGDTQWSLASPLKVLQRSGSIANDHKIIRKLAAEEAVELIVVGLPVDLNGNVSLAAQGVLDETAKLATVLDVPIETYDERMTSAVANKNLQAIGMNSRKRRTEVDKHAAAVILQGWFDSRSGGQS